MLDKELQQACRAFRYWRSNKKRPNERIPGHLRQMVRSLEGRVSKAVIFQSLEIQSQQLKRIVSEKFEQEPSKQEFVELRQPLSVGQPVVIAVRRKDGNVLSVRLPHDVAVVSIINSFCERHDIG